MRFLARFSALSFLVLMSGAASACYGTDPQSVVLRNEQTFKRQDAGAAASDALSKGDLHALGGCQVFGMELILSGLYKSEVDGRLDRVDVTGNRARGEFEVCYRDGCSGLLLGLQAASDRLAGAGYPTAAAEVKAIIKAASAPEACKLGKRIRDITSSTDIEVREAQAKQVLGLTGRNSSGEHEIHWSDGTVDLMLNIGTASLPKLVRTLETGDGKAGSKC